MDEAVAKDAVCHKYKSDAIVKHRDSLYERVTDIYIFTVFTWRATIECDTYYDINS